MKEENKLVKESLAFVKAYMADKSNDNYGSHYQLELDYAYEVGQMVLRLAKRTINLQQPKE